MRKIIAAIQAILLISLPICPAEAMPFTAPGGKPLEDSLAQAQGYIRGILEIQAFDPQILLSKGDANKRQELATMDCDFGLRVANFYSENAAERETGFDRDIKEPLLQALKIAADYSYDFPQTLGCLVNSGPYFSPLMNAAVKDIFTNAPGSLRSLSEALESLKENGSLSNLGIFVKLAGFFYDEKALGHLTTNMTNFFNAHPKDSLDFKDPLVRFALLRIIQWGGEFSKLVLPSTLNLSPDLPDDNLMKELRDRHLAHMSLQKLNKVKEASPGADTVFSELYDDLAHLTTLYTNILDCLPSGASFDSPAACWDHFKALPDARNAPASSYKWAGLTSLRKRFSPAQPQPQPVQAPDMVPFEAELQALWPLPFPESKRQVISQSGQEVKTTLTILGNRTIKEAGELEAALEKSLKRSVNLNSEALESFLEEHQSANEEMRRLNSKSKGGEEATRKAAEDKISRLKMAATAEILGLTVEQVEEILSQGEAIKAAGSHQGQLRDRLMGLRKDKPLGGPKNFTDAYQAFWNKIQGIQEKIKLKILMLQMHQNTFDWTKAPSTPEEMLFYKVHGLEINSLNDKLRYRASRIKELLGVIDFFRDLANIQTTAPVEASKETLDSFICEKSQHMVGLLQKLKSNSQVSTETFESLKAIQQALYGLVGNIPPVGAAQGIYDLRRQAAVTIHRFVSALKSSHDLGGSDHQAIIKTLLSPAPWGETGGPLIAPEREAHIKSWPRRDEPRAVSKEIEATVKENPFRYLAYEFFVAAFYEFYKEVNDYPGLGVLKPTDKVRNFFFHTDPFGFSALKVGGPYDDANIRVKNPYGQVAKEVSVLTLNVKLILEGVLAAIEGKIS